MIAEQLTETYDTIAKTRELTQTLQDPNLSRRRTHLRGHKRSSIHLLQPIVALQLGRRHLV